MTRDQFVDWLEARLAAEHGYEVTRYTVDQTGLDDLQIVQGPNGSVPVRLRCVRTSPQ